MNQWTAELSGLATGRNPAEYLEAGVVEDHALMTLFAAIEPTDAAAVYLECVNCLLNCKEKEGASRRHATGSWARVVQLGRRVLDEKMFADVDDGLRRSTLSSVTGVLTSPAAMRNGYIASVLLCLCRRLIIAAQSFHDADEKSEGRYRDYETWLKDLVCRNGNPLIGAFIKPLIELLPVEPLQFLRLNHRTFSLNRAFLRLTRDYLVTLRSRIGDLDPSINRGALFRSQSVSEDGSTDPMKSPKLIKETIQFIVEFGKSNAVPRGLIRQINFHRYHFRKTTLKVLLHPGLVSYIGAPEYRDLVNDKPLFESWWIRLIEELAYRRQDRAISGSEAKVIIKAIQAGSKERETVQVGEPNSQDGRVDYSHVNIDSALSTILDAALRQRPYHGTKENNKQMPFPPYKKMSGRELMISKVRQDLNKSMDESSRSRLSAEILKSLLEVIIDSKETSLDVAIQNSSTLSLEKYRSWWVETGTGLSSILSELLCDSSVSVLQKHLQYQTIALCLAHESREGSSMTLPISLLLSTIFSVGRNKSLGDMCFLVTRKRRSVKSLMGLVLDYLPLSTSRSVRYFTSIVLHCACALTTCESLHLNFLEQNDGSQSDLDQLSQRNDSILPTSECRGLFNVLRWIVANPWRLVDDRNGRKSWEDEKIYMGTLPFLRKVTAFLESRSWAVPEVSVSDYFGIETRCRWGRSSSIHSFLRTKMASGSDRMTVVNEAIAALVDAERSGERAEWIREGTVRFLDEQLVSSLSCDDEGIIHSDESKSSPFRFVENRLRLEESDVGRSIFENFMTMEHCYFHGCGIREALQHVSEVMVPQFWPFQRRHKAYLLASLRRPCISPVGSGQGLRLYSLVLGCFAVDGIVKKGSGEEDMVVGTQRNHNNAIVDLSLQIAQARRLLLQSGVSSLDEGRMNGLNESANTSLLRSSSDAYPHAMGVALALHLCQRCSTRPGTEWEDIMGEAVGQVSSSLSEQSAIEVLDSMLNTASLVPFSGHFADDGYHEEYMKICDSIMEVVLKERAYLLDSESCRPYWASIEMLNGKGRDDDTLIIFREWVGGRDADPLASEVDLFSYLSVCTCVGRIFCCFTRLPTEVQSRYLSRIGEEIVEQGFLSNILKVYKMICGRSHAEERLREASVERVLECARRLQKELVDVVECVIEQVQRLFLCTADDVLQRVLTWSPDMRLEMTSLLQARGVV